MLDVVIIEEIRRRERERQEREDEERRHIPLPLPEPLPPKDDAPPLDEEEWGVIVIDIA